MTFETLCEKINLPAEVVQNITALHAQLEWEQLYPQMEKLFTKETWEDGLEKLRELLGADEQGYRMLTCMLQAAVATSKRYQEAGIPEDIFTDTMAAFSRFVREHKDSYGEYGFDRDFWTPRQLAMEEFRIGELEYEKEVFDGKKAVSIHIPSDARLQREVCEASIAKAVDFFTQYDREYADSIFYCSSWLLAPNLRHVLPAHSHILRFQMFFSIISIDLKAEDYMEWVFKNPAISLDEVPQDTSLQRNLKAYPQKGGKVGNATGILIK